LLVQIKNTLRESINKARAFLSYSVSPKVLITYESYRTWKETYFSLHKDHQVEAAERLGRAFCQEFKIHDRRLEDSQERIHSEARIFSRYVNRYRG
jgi:hypothetical protein